MTTWAASVHSAGRCAVCGRTDGLEAHHLIGRGHKLFRTDPLNSLLLCWQHHHGSTLSPHGAPKAFREWLKITYPEKYKWVQENKWTIKTL